MEELVSFGADVLLPIKLMDDSSRSPKSAILPLVLTLSFSPEKALAMTETFLRLGATPAQTDLSRKTPSHCFAASFNPELHVVLQQQDAPGAKKAINHSSIHGHEFSPRAESALTDAILARNPVQVVELLKLEQGRPLNSLTL